MTVTPRYLEPSARRRGPRRRRGLPLRSVGLGLLVGVAVAGAAAFVLGRVGNGDERKVVERFGAAWADGDYGTMYDQLDADSRRRVSLAAFTRAYRTADLTGTTTRISTSKPDKDGDTWKLPVKVRTRAFGLVTGNVRIPVGGDPPRLRWSPELTFPGCATASACTGSRGRPGARRCSRATGARWPIAMASPPPSAPRPGSPGRWDRPAGRG